MLLVHLIFLPIYPAHFLKAFLLGKDGGYPGFFLPFSVPPQFPFVRLFPNFPSLPAPVQLWAVPWPKLGQPNVFSQHFESGVSGVRRGAMCREASVLEATESPELPGHGALRLASSRRGPVSQHPVCSVSSAPAPLCAMLARTGFCCWRS